jgi:uncharacterized membrane protein YdjX (TVP38/TMEM64 family)
LVGALVLVGGLTGLWLIAPGWTHGARALLEPQAIEALVTRAGVWGPILIVGLMALAVVASPLPSAPIAMAAGAAYGLVGGTVQVVIGAELGALIAFGLARVLGHDAIRRLLGDRVDAGLMGSQTALTVAVFASRLMPFLSFDMVSYAAGLSRLHLWRFALATLAGVIPVSFLLVHMGQQAINGHLGQAGGAALALGLITGAPLIWAALRHRA